MNLTALKETLELRDIRTAPGAPPSHVDDPPPVGIADELFDRYRNSTRPESQQLCVVLSAILEVIKAEGLHPTPITLFAAVMSALQKTDVLLDPGVAAAMCTLLSSILDRVPTTVLRARCAQATQLVAGILEASNGADSPVPRSALPCLCQLLAAMGPTDWMPCSRGFALVLTASLDKRPKLRRKAHSGLVDVLAALQRMPAVLISASDAVLRMCRRILPGPQAAAQAAAAAPSKHRQRAEEAITVAVADALHLLGALKQSIFLLSGPATQGVCELLLRLYPLRQPLLHRHTTDTLLALTSSSASHLPPAALADVLTAVLSSESAWDKNDADAALALIRLVEQAALRLAAVDFCAASAILPRVCHALVPLLASHQEGVRRAASFALCNVLASNCVNESAIKDALTTENPPRGRKPASMQRVAAAIESSLGPQYSDAWEHALPVAAELIERLGLNGASLANGILLRIGHLCAGGDDVAAEMEACGGGVCDEERVMTAAQNALGRALRAIGPEAVLETLPLALEEGLAGSDEARTWLLPLLRMHVRGARLEYWAAYMLPLAQRMGARAAHASRDAARNREAQICGALEAQIWATLPSFCSWAEDVAECFSDLSQAIGPAFTKHADLRTPICIALTRLATQTRLALRAAGEPVGHADPTHSAEDDDNKGLDALLGDAEEDDVLHAHIPLGFQTQTARSTLQALRSQARNWLPLLLNSFVATPANKRGPLQAATSAYACICEPAVVAVLFRSAMTKFMKVTQQARTGELGRDAVTEGGDSDSERCSTFMEAALSLAGGLDASGIQVLYKAAVPGTKEKDPSAQKKAYKVLAYVLESRMDFAGRHFQELVCVLLEGSQTAVSAAKRYRLRCLKAAILVLVGPEGPLIDITAMPHESTIVPLGSLVEGKSPRMIAAWSVITPMVTEIVLCLKEANKRARAAAYELLVNVARALHQAEPPTTRVEHHTDHESVVALSSGGLRTLVNLVLGGLVGSTAHMVSASVMALARLLFEFAPVLAGLVPELLPAVLMLLRSRAREVIKSVLGFVKVVAMRMPVAELQAFLPAICEGILLWAEDSKNKFRLKVRVILEKLARRCGFEALEAAVPPTHRALLTHIRKQHNRKERKKGDATPRMEWDLADDIEEEDGPDDDEDMRSKQSGMARTTNTRKTAARSDWNSDIFGDDDDDVDDKNYDDGGRRSLAGRSSARTAFAPGRGTGNGGQRAFGSARSAPIAAGKAARLLPSGGGGGDPLDLLDATTSRVMMRAAAGVAGKATRGNSGDPDGDFTLGRDGRMIINDDEALLGGKRKRNEAEDAGFDSDDSDFEDLKGFSGLSLALRGAKSVAAAPTLAASMGGKSLAAKSTGGRSARTAGAGGQREGQSRRAQHTGDRFKARKSGAGGDVKGNSKVEPYAYWPLDRKLMNRRASKAKGAKVGLDKVVRAAKDGAAKGRKAKRTRDV